jgi:hypothetical protein
MLAAIKSRSCANDHGLADLQKVAAGHQLNINFSC